LDFFGVNVTGVEVITPGTSHPNVLETFWQKGIIDINRGMDFNPRGKGNEVYAKYTHLNHEDFQYRITVRI
jgi:Hemocyanin, ig-like domain